MNYAFGQFVSTDSAVHRLDPRVKILSLFALSVLILKSGNLGKLAGITVALSFIIPLSGLRFRKVLGAVRPILILGVFFFLLHLFFTEGTPVHPGVPFISREGLLRGTLVSWQFFALVLSAAILTMTTDPSEIICGLERLLRPLNRIGIPSHDIAVMISIALRFVPTLFGEIERMKEAQAARGVDFRSGSFTERLRKITSLVIPLILSTFRRADELAQAMEGRGYERGPRTYLRELKMGYADYTVMISTLVFTAALYVLSV